MNKTYLSHYGIKGQRWGVRRFQNEDGSLTSEGLRRYGTAENMDRVRSRNKKIAIGVTAGAAVALTTASVIVSRRNKKIYKENMKNKQAMIDQLNTNKEAAKDILKDTTASLEAFESWAKKRNLDNLAKARAAKQIKRAQEIASGVVKPKNIKIPKGSNVLINSVDKKGLEKSKAFIDVIGGFVKIKGGV